MALSYLDLQGLLKQTYIRIYTERIPPARFLRSFFPSRTYGSTTVNIEVSRGTERIAADVIRGGEGNRNTFSRWSAKEYLPPEYHEYFEHSQLKSYERVMGELQTGGRIGMAGVLANEIALKYITVRDKIERAKEYQCSQVLETGVVSLKNGDDIDYHRKSDSMVDNTADAWSSSGADIEGQLVTAGDFLRIYGKSGIPEIICVMSSQAWIYLKNSDYFDKNANYRQVRLIDIQTPQSQSFGASYHGTITAGPYTVHCWTYDEGYEDSTGAYTRYWPEENIFVVPYSGTDFELSHGGIEAIQQSNGGPTIGLVSSEYYQWDFIDPKHRAHEFHISSAPLPVPVTIDKIYTAQVLASGGGQG